MTKLHYSILETNINRALEISGLTPGMFDNATRYRWTVYHMATDKIPTVRNQLYQYLDDNHIDTALRKITETK